MKKLGVIFGGMSTENKVSCVSGASVIRNLNKEKYEIFPIFIDENGNWFKVKMQADGEIKIDDKEQIENIVEYIKQMDVIFPVLHGLYGEDGTIQGLFELLKIPYVGCGVLASSIGMDKVYTKIIFDKAEINQTKYVYIRKCDDKYIYVDDSFNEKIMELNEVSDLVTEKLNFPMFVKPSNSGSSVGVKKANDVNELKLAIENASKYDRKIIIEEGIKGKEVECAILEKKDEIIASTVGEIKSAEEFYSFDAKYNIPNSQTIIPAKIEKNLIEEIQKNAIKAFKSIDGRGLARVDFFIEEGTNNIYINEINTMPGFTKISMYPKLFESDKISYSELLDILINYAINKFDFT